MLRDEVERYTKLTGEDGWHVPIMKVGAYLDGYDKGLEVLDKIRAEIMELDTNYNFEGIYKCQAEVLGIIDKYRSEGV